MTKLPDKFGSIGIQISEQLEVLRRTYSINMTWDDYAKLRRDAMRIRSMFIKECGYDHQYIKIDDDDDIATYYNIEYGYEYRVPNPIPGCTRRIAAICDRYGLCFYVQGDPRGNVLYISPDEMSDYNYSTLGHCVLERC